MKTSVRGLDAVGYVRMSSEEQGKSPDQQRQQILKLADKLQCRVIRWYEDLGISGDDIQRRESFRRMVADATKRKDFKVILCWAQDRFGRFDSIEAGEWVAPLRRAGVKLVTVAEGEISWTDGAGRLIFTIQQEGKHTFLLDMARTSTRGRTQAVKRVGFVGGRPPYGYDREIYDERGKLQMRVARGQKFRRPRDWRSVLVRSRDEQEVAAVRWMFRAFCGGMSLDAISHRLNARKVPGARRGPWCSSSVRCILENPAYVGDQVWNRRHVGKYFSILAGEVATAIDWEVQMGGRHFSICPNPTSEWIVVPNAHPAIVSRKLFKRANARLQTRLGRAYQRPGLPLSGLVTCGHCGKHMYYHPRRAVHNQNPMGYYRITCRSREDYGPSVCDSRTIKEPWLLSTVIGLLTSRVLDSGVEKRLRKALKQDLRSKHQSPGEQKRVQLRLEQLDRQINRGLDNLLKAPANCVQAASERLASWQRNRDQIMRQIDEHNRATPKRIDATIAELMFEVRLLRIGLATTERELLHHTLQRLIEGITLWFEPGQKPRQCSQFKRGIMVTKCPFVDGRTIRQEFEFCAKDLDKCDPRWHFKLRDPQRLGRRPLYFPSSKRQLVMDADWAAAPAFT